MLVGLILIGHCVIIFFDDFAKLLFSFTIIWQLLQVIYDTDPPFYAVLKKEIYSKMDPWQSRQLIKKPES